MQMNKVAQAVGVALRDYQDDWVSRIRREWSSHRCVLGVLQTGGGKTVCFSELTRMHAEGELFGAKGASIAVVHRKELVSQISMSLARAGVVHRVVAPPATVSLIRKKHLKAFGKAFINDHAMAGVASVQTLTSKSTMEKRALMDWVNQVSLGAFDEGHHYVKQGIWGRAVEMLEHAKLLFVTATPERADGVGLGDGQRGGGGFCEVMVEGPSMKEMIERGYLCDFIYKAPNSDLDVRGLAVGKNGDFNATALRARVVESHIVGDVVSHYRKHADGLRAIVFSTDVATANEQAAAFRAAGYTAEALSGGTEQGERDRVLALFESGAIQVLVNVDLFDEGFDVPAVGCCIMARPTQSLAKFLQMVGRALRIMKGKERAIIIDMVRNWERHGMPTWPRVWTLKNREKRSSSTSDTIPQRVCAACTGPYEAFHKVCPYCGYEPVPVDRSGPEKVDGDLMELDREAMDALFTAYKQANLSAEEYAQDQIARHIPKIGRAQDARRHQSLMHRRGVLQNLVGWWHGTQPSDRSESEKQRRFYLRFGVDIVSAFTLDMKATDGLISRIGESFGKDALH